MRTALFRQIKLSTLLTSRNGKDADINSGKEFLKIPTLGTLTILFKVDLLKRQAYSELLWVIVKVA